MYFRYKNATNAAVEMSVVHSQEKVLHDVVVVVSVTVWQETSGKHDDGIHAIDVIP